MIIIYLQMGGGKIKGIKWLFYFSFLLKMITFAVYFYPLLHRDGTVQILGQRIFLVGKLSFKRIA